MRKDKRDPLLEFQADKHADVAETSLQNATENFQAEIAQAHATLAVYYLMKSRE